MSAGRDIRDLIAWMLATAASRIGTERYVRTMLEDAAKLHDELTKGKQ